MHSDNLGLELAILSPTAWVKHFVMESNWPVTSKEFLLQQLDLSSHVESLLNLVKDPNAISFIIMKGRSSSEYKFFEALSAKLNEMLQDEKKETTSPSPAKTISWETFKVLSVKLGVSPKTLLMGGKAMPGAWSNPNLWQ